MEAPALAKLLGVEPIALRQFLRKEFPRAANQKGQRWFVEPHMIAAAKSHFAARR